MMTTQSYELSQVVLSCYYSIYSLQLNYEEAVPSFTKLRAIKKCIHFTCISSGVGI